MNQSIGLKRCTIDKFYTKSEIALKCYDKFIEIINPLTETDLIIEPSAGNGSFSNIIMKNFDNYNFYDIEPEADNIIKQDFLLLDFEQFINKYDNIHILGNPAFGRQASIAKKFIQKSCKYASSIGFILPKSFKKDTFKKSFDLKFHLIYEMDLENNAFILGNNGNDYNVPCIFQIWKKKLFDRVIPIIIESVYFAFVKKNELPDFSIRRVGFYASKIYNGTKDSTQSHYYIKLLDNINKTKFFEQYETVIQFEHNNTVGPKSISKQELIKKINTIDLSNIQNN
jgi:hypothetical protein